MNKSHLTLPLKYSSLFGSILETILENEFLSGRYKKRLLEAGQAGHAYPGSCHKYRCDHEIFNHTQEWPTLRQQTLFS
jgi:hypothetical protein